MLRNVVIPIIVGTLGAIILFVWAAVNCGCHP